MAFFRSILSRLRAFREAAFIELSGRDRPAEIISRHLDRSGAGQPKDQLGKRGEELAQSFYHKRKARIIDANLMIGRTEIDLIADENGTLVFVEVKTRSSRSFDADPADAVTPQKRKRMIRAARIYRQWRRWEDVPVRFDIIAVYWPSGREPEITHHKDAFR